MILSNYFKKYKVYKFSKLAHIGDLSIYNYEEMSLLIIKWSKTIIESKDYFDVVWEGENTKIKIRYNKSTFHFIQIIEEECTDIKMKFYRAIL